MPRHAASGQKLAFWIGSIAILLFCIAGLGLKIAWDDHYGTRQERKAVFLQWRQAGDQRAAEFRKVFKGVMYTSTPPQQVVAMVGGQVQIQQSVGSQPGRINRWFYDPQWGSGFSVTYNPDGLIDAGSCCGTPFQGTNTRPKLPDRFAIEESFQKAWHLLAPRFTGMNLPVTVLPWLVLVGLTWFWKDMRLLLIAAAFWLTFLTGLVLMMSPNHHLLEETFSNDPLFWIALMLVGAGGVGLYHRFVKAIDPSLCTACGYRLIKNTTGECPECGQQIESWQRFHLKQCE